MQPKTTSWADSVRAWASGYKDSVVVDMHYDNETGFKNIYVHKDHKDSWRGGVEDKSNLATANWQYWIVPSFFAIITITIIFAVVLYRDNEKALKEKKTESILSVIKNKYEKK
jgi:hypothetical protein